MKNKQPFRILNCYAGIGGNRKLWDGPNMQVRLVAWRQERIGKHGLSSLPRLPSTHDVPSKPRAVLAPNRLLTDGFLFINLLTS